jgi:hypothetical protein
MKWDSIKEKLRVLKDPISWPGDLAVVWKIVKWTWQRISDYETAASLQQSLPKKAWVMRTPATDTWIFLLGIAWLTIVVMFPDALSGFSSGNKGLLRRVKALVNELTLFVDKNEGNVSAIHYLYDAKLRGRVDTTLSELAAQDLYILGEEWEINPQIQTAKNIRDNIIARFTTLADRLERRIAAPQSKIIGEIESGEFGVSGSSASYGKVIHSVNVSVTLRVTNKVKIETTLKRADIKLTIGRTTYVAHRQELWNWSTEPDLLKKITNETPIRQGPATIGELEFHVEGLQRPNQSTICDTSVVLFDEFDNPHVIRNRNLRITA